MGLLNQIGRTEGLLAFWDRLIRWGPAILGATASSVLAGWAGSATKALEQYSPSSWVFRAIVGALGFLGGAALWSFTRVNLQRLEYARNLSMRTAAFNPLDDNFTKKRIQVEALRSQFNEPVVGKTFVDCELVGPAVICLIGPIAIHGVGIGNCEFVRIRNGARILNAIPFINLTVTRGKLTGLTIFVPEGSVENVNAGVSGIQWITH
jgi:hypothetical protein